MDSIIIIQVTGMVKLCIMAETLEHTADIFLNDRKTNKNSDKGEYIWITDIVEIMEWHTFQTKV